MRPHPLLLLACLGAAPLSPWAADAPVLTLYRADGDALFQAAGNGPSAAGYLTVDEEREAVLGADGSLVIDDLPPEVDAENIRVRLPPDGVQLTSQRLQGGAAGGADLLQRNLGHHVTFIDDQGYQWLAGTLLAVDPQGAVTLRTDAGGTALVRDYVGIEVDQAVPVTTTRLELGTDAGADQAGRALRVALAYPTRGIGWRAAYTATLDDAGGCQLTLTAMASIANRSGRSWPASDVRLIAGAPHLPAQPRPRPFAMQAMAKAAATAPALPQQGAVGDYHVYRLPHAIALPDDSISLTPLYAPRALTCTRSWVLDGGTRGVTAQPALEPGTAAMPTPPITSSVAFLAFDNLPAGRWQAFAADTEAAVPTLIGAGQLEDTPQGQSVRLALGTAFDLRARRERTDFQLDRRARKLEEAFRITLSNAGDHARLVSVREHPWRWRQWQLVDSSVAPEQVSPDRLAFSVEVPPHGRATLDYRVAYAWSVNDRPE